MVFLSLISFVFAGMLRIIQKKSARKSEADKCSQVSTLQRGPDLFSWNSVIYKVSWNFSAPSYTAKGSWVDRVRNAQKHLLINV